MSAAPRGTPPARRRQAGRPGRSSPGWTPREIISRLDFWKSPARPPLPEPPRRALTIASRPRGIRSCRQVQTSRPRRAEHRRRLRALSNGQRARPVPGCAARAAAPAQTAVAAAAATGPRRAAPVVRVQHRHASRPGPRTGPRSLASGAPPPGNPPGSDRDWPVLSARFACQWHGTEGAQRQEDPERLGALSAVLVVFKRSGTHPLS